METNRIAPGLLRERLDPKFYGRHFVEAAKRAVESRFEMLRLDSLVAESAPITYGIVQPGGFVAAGDGVRLIRAVDFRDGAIDAAQTEWVTHKIEAPYARARVQPEDYLITIAGTVGEVALAPTGIEPANLNQSVARLRFRKGVVDPAWVLAFHRSACGRLTLLREQRGSIQQHLNIEDIGPISVPIPQPDAQRYIGDKIRLAERLRERAYRLVGEVRKQHVNLIPSFRPSREKWNTFRLSPGSVDDVIVPHFYPPAVTEYLAGRYNEPVGRLCETVFSGETYESDDHGVDQATSRSCSGRFLRRPCNRVRPPSRADLDLQPHDLLLTNAAHDKGYIGTDVTYFHGGPRNIPSAKVMVLRPNRTVVPASYLFAYLQTPVGYLQIQSAIRGISAGIRAQDVASIRIPLPMMTEQERAAWLAMDMQMADAGAAEATASLLCVAATQIVERLIEAQVHEADLVAAQQALDAADRGPDRDILRSLRQAGDPDAPPLITEVDVLYALLDQSEGDSA